MLVAKQSSTTLIFDGSPIQLAKSWAHFQIKKTRTICAFVAHRKPFNSRILYLTLDSILLVA
jgi:hypothetical protein